MAPATSESSACRACAKAKRRCNKQKPVCMRCKERGVPCTYPPSKPSCFVLLDDYQEQAIQRRPRSHVPPYSGLSPFKDNTSPVIWFARPSTWLITPWPKELSSHGCPRMKQHVDRINQWFVQWVATGSNPFIHAKLYQYHFPVCIQDAYTTLSAYFDRTPQNEHFVFQVLEARISQLLHLDIPQMERDSPSTCLAIIRIAHSLARLHASIAYIFVALFNGDIRLRHCAEQILPVMETWLLETVTDAAVSLQAASSTGSCPANGNVGVSEAFWASWIVAESLRRTFLVGSTIITSYAMIKAGKVVPAACKGGMAFTLRQGAWEAQSAAAWEEMAMNMNLGLFHVGDARRWLEKERGKGEMIRVDDFARTFLEGTFGNA